MIYLAQPYSDPDPDVMERRASQGMRAAAQFLRSGVHIYAPIPAWHEAAKQYTLPREFSFWEGHDLHFLEKCDELWVLVLDGWADSRGVSAEIAHALSQGLPISYFDRRPDGMAYRR